MWEHFANVLKQARPPAEFPPFLFTFSLYRKNNFVRFFLKGYEKKKTKQVRRYFRDCQNLKEIASTII